MTRIQDRRRHGALAGSTIALFVLIGLAGLTLALGTADAHQNPASCGTSAVSTQLVRTPSAQAAGQKVEYRVLASNGGSGACDVDAATLTFRAPAMDGSATGASTVLGSGLGLPASGAGDRCYRSSTGPACPPGYAEHIRPELSWTVAVTPSATQATASVELTGSLHDISGESALTASKSVSVGIVGKLVPTKSVDKLFARPGETLRYAIVVQVAGNGPVTGNVVDAYDCRLAVVPGSITGGGVLDAGACTITWSSVTLGTGQSRRFDFDATIPDPLVQGPAPSQACVDAGWRETLVNLVSIGAEQSRVETCAGIGRLVPAKSVDKPVATPGETLAYTIHVAHVGTAPETADVVDTYDCRLAVVAGSIAPAGTHDPAACRITWPAVAMRPGDAPRAFSFQARIPDPLPEEGDPTPACQARSLGEVVLNTVAVKAERATVETCIEFVQHPASCAASAVQIRTFHPSALSGTVTHDQTYSASAALAKPGSGLGHGDAQQAGATSALPTVTHGVLRFSGSASTAAIASDCNAVKWAGVGSAWGVATTDGLRVDGALRGLPLGAASPVTWELRSDALRTTATSTNGTAVVAANLYDLTLGGMIGTMPWGHTLYAGPAPANTRVDLTVPLSTASGLLADVTVGHVILNAQARQVDALTGCAEDTASALIVVVYDVSGATVRVMPFPVTLGVPTTPLARVTVSEVEVASCPATGPGGEPSGLVQGGCSAAGILFDTTTSRLSSTPWGAMSGFSVSEAERRLAAGGASGSARQVDINALVSGVHAAAPSMALHVDDVDSSCDLAEEEDRVAGDASINALDMTLDVPLAGADGLASPSGLQVAVKGGALRSAIVLEDGIATYSQTFVDYVVTVEGTAYRIAHAPAANTVLVDVPNVVKVVVNHRAGAGCAHEANALLVRIYDALDPGVLLTEIKVGHVAATC